MSRLGSTPRNYGVLKLWILLAIGSLAGVSNPVVAANDGIWQELRNGFQLSHVSNSRIFDELNWFSSHTLHVARTSERSKPYLHYIVQQVKQRKMPLELALIPMVESAFDPYAYSRSNAAGLWQFTPITAKRFKLRNSVWYDGRRDLVDGTEAALNYLEILSKRFGGDWLLALAAYNAGGGTVNKAIRRNRAKGLATDFWSLDLPAETKRYVPRILALAKVIRSPYRYKVKLHPVANKPMVRVVPTQLQIDLAKAAKWSRTPIEQLYRLNPGLNRWATDPSGPHRLLVPAANADALLKKLKTTPLHARTEWTRHIVREGDTLRSIASRYANTAAVLERVNQLGGEPIKVGQQILVPSATMALNRYPQDGPRRVAKAKRRVSSRTRGKSKAVAKGKLKIIHTVRSGDSLWSIAHKHQVHVTELLAWNGLKKGQPLRVGRKVKLFVDKPEPTTLRYTVREGDSLSVIGAKHRVSVSDLRRWNGLRANSHIVPGQKLKLVLPPRA